MMQEWLERVLFVSLIVLVTVSCCGLLLLWDSWNTP